MKLKKQYSLEEIALKYNCKIIGDKDTLFDSVSSLQKSKKNSISFISDSKSLNFLSTSNLSCVISTSELSSAIKIPIIISDNPLLLFSKLINETYNPFESSLFLDNSSTTQIDDTVKLGHNVVLGSHVTIGKNTMIYPNVTIYDNTSIGDNVIIHAGAVIGSDGFGLVKDSSGWIKVPHIGQVIIKNNVEIGANSTIDRGTIDSTIIHDNVKIDNHVHVAHNVEIGKNTAIAACVGIAGSTTIGENCTIGGGTGINGHINITDDVHLHGMTMVTKSIDKSGSYASGTTVEPVKSWRKNQARFKELNLLAKTIKKKNLESKND